MNSLEQYSNNFNSDDTASYSSVESCRNLTVPHPHAGQLPPPTSTMSIASKSSMTSSIKSKSLIGDDNMTTHSNTADNDAPSSRSKSVEDASQGLLSMRKRKAERRPTVIALPTYCTTAIDHTTTNNISNGSTYHNNTIVDYSDIPPCGKRLRRQSAVAPAVTKCASSSSNESTNSTTTRTAITTAASSQKQTKKVKKSEIISIAQKSLKEALGILTAFQETSPSSTVLSTPPRTATSSPSPRMKTNDRNDRFFTSNSVQRSSSIGRIVTNEMTDLSPLNTTTRTTTTTTSLRIKQLEDRIKQVQTQFSNEMKRLEKDLKELKQHCQPEASSPATIQPSSKQPIVQNDMNEAFTLQNYSKHVQDSFKASKLMMNDNTTSSSFHIPPHSMIPFALASTSTSNILDTTITNTPTKTTKTTNTTMSANNSIVTQATDKDVISGRGHGANRHGGNQIYRHLVKKYKFPYVKAISDLDKHNISMQVVNEIHEGGGRFLKRVYVDGKGGGVGGVAGDTAPGIQWSVMDMIEIKKKVGQALRENASEVRDILLKQSAAAATATATSTSTATTSTTTTTMPPTPVVTPTAPTSSHIQMDMGDISAVKMSPTMAAPTPTSSPVLSQGFPVQQFAPSA